MITRFHVTNYRSIVDLELDYRYGEGKAPNGYRTDSRLAFLEARVEGVKRPVRAVPVMAYYGLNAGGKSTIFSAFATLQRILAEGGGAPFQPNALHHGYEKDTCFDLEWVIGDAAEGWHLCRLAISLRDGAITAECCALDGVTLYRARRGVLEEERFSSARGSVFTASKVAEVFRVCCVDGDGGQARAVLSAFAREFPGLHPCLSRVAGSLADMCVVEGAAGFSRLAQVGSASAPWLDEAGLADVARGLRRMDVDVERVSARLERREVFDAVAQRVVERVARQVYVERRDVDGRLRCFRLEEESRGTQALFWLLAALEQARGKSAVFLVDGLDEALHPLLLREVVGCFVSKECNVCSRQLVFSAHDADLLEGQRLRRSEVGIVSKTRAKGTMVTRLCDFDDVRNVDNFRKDYLDGAYSGIPLVASVCP